MELYHSSTEAKKLTSLFLRCSLGAQYARTTESNTGPFHCRIQPIEYSRSQNHVRLEYAVVGERHRAEGNSSHSPGTCCGGSSKANRTRTPAWRASQLLS